MTLIKQRCIVPAMMRQSAQQRRAMPRPGGTQRHKSIRRVTPPTKRDDDLSARAAYNTCLDYGRAWANSRFSLSLPKSTYWHECSKTERALKRPQEQSQAGRQTGGQEAGQNGSPGEEKERFMEPRPRSVQRIQRGGAGCRRKVLRRRGLARFRERPAGWMDSRDQSRGEGACRGVVAF